MYNNWPVCLSTEGELHEDSSLNQALVKKHYNYLPVTDMAGQGKDILVEAFKRSLLQDVINPAAAVQLSHLYIWTRTVV